MLDLLRFPGMSRVPGLVHAVTTRGGGVSIGSHATLNLGRSVGDDASFVAENRRRVTAALCVSAPPRFARQVHGKHVLRAEEIEDDAALGADAILCAQPGVAVGVLGADCPGVLIVDPEHRALAVVHSGWRGTVLGVVPAALAALVRDHGAEPTRLLAAIGPGISGARYEVGEEVAEAMAARFEGDETVVLRAPGRRAHVDLAAAIRSQLARGGVGAGSIETLSRCTFDDASLFFSHRRDGAGTGRHALVAAWV